MLKSIPGIAEEARNSFQISMDLKLKFQSNMKRKIVGRINQKMDSVRRNGRTTTFNLVNSSISIVSNIESVAEPYQCNLSEVSIVMYRQFELLSIVSNY